MRRSLFVPLGKQELKTNIGRLRRVEVSEVARSQALADRPEVLMDSQAYEFLRDVWSHPKKYVSIISYSPHLKYWVENIWAPVSRNSVSLEREQLAKFFRAMQAVDPDPSNLPGFTYDDISCWRIFVQIFPESLSLLEQVSMNYKLPHAQRMAISLLSSALATTDDSRISSRACAIVRRLSREVTDSTVRSYREYKWRRQFLFAGVEAGEVQLAVFLNFIEAHVSTGWEFRLHRDYYKDLTDETFTRSTVKKLELPLRRDVVTRQIVEYHLNNVLRREDVDQAYRNLSRTGLLNR